MTPDINKLLERLRTYYGDDLACRMLLMDARHALEAMAGEVERLTELAYGIGSATIPAWSASKKHAELLNKMLGEAEAECDRLAGEVARLDRMLDGARGCLKETEAEAARLKAQVEALTREKDEYRNALNRASRWKSRAEIAEAQAAALRAAAGDGK